MQKSLLPSLGTELRRLIDLLDGDLERHYASLGLRYRPRYTPIVRALEAIGPSSIRAISLHSGLTHSAVSQTVAQMVREGLLQTGEGKDGRERIAEPTAMLTEMIPALHAQWWATKAAADRLDAELSAPLLAIVQEAVDALQRHCFADRIAAEVRCDPQAASA